MTRPRTGWPYYATLLGVVVLTFLVHEAAHWFAGVALGYDMRVSLNGATFDGRFGSARDALVVSAAGPLATFAQAVLAAWLVASRGWLPAYTFLFVACCMRLAAAFVSIVHPNDEASMSAALGLGVWTLPIAVVSALLAMTWTASRRLRLHWTTNLASSFVCGLAFATVVLYDAR
jgi:hypothetical protein